MIVAMLLAGLTACSSSDELADTERKVSARLAFSLSVSADDGTRQGATVAQATGSFRGIELVRLIPFGVQGPVTATDAPKYFSAGAMGTEFDKTTSRFYLTQNCSFQPGTASFLFYGRAIPATGATDAENGALVASIDASQPPSATSFSLKQIVTTTAVPADGQALADYLTAIANASVTVGSATATWPNSSHSVLKALFRNFTYQDQYGHCSVLAGSSANVSKHVADLKAALTAASFVGDATAAALATAIIAQIDNDDSLPAVAYPASLGLPDGAAALLWNGSAFVPQVATNTLADVNSIDRYCYPAELYYYVNSQIRTSTAEVSSDDYMNAATWTTVLSKYEYDQGMVSANTKAVAIIDPIQYAVARLQVQLKQVAATLKDSQGDNVTVGTTSFPLTGIIVGGQHAVAFDFTPQDTPDRFVYDRDVQSDGTVYLSSSTALSAATNTLLLQTKENDEAVTVVLEFQNNSDADFHGINGGVVYRGTKFYLVGSVKRPTQTAGIEDYKKRVFTQDYTTTLTMTVTSLEKAYNVLPDILSGRLEVGVELTSDWVQATTTVVPL